MVTEFPTRWCRVAIHAVVPRVERLDHTSDRTALASCVRTLHHDQETWSKLAVCRVSSELKTKLEESLLGCGEPFGIFALL